MTAIRKGSEVPGKEEKNASAEEMYEALWIIRGWGERMESVGGSLGEPPGERIIFPKGG